MNSTRSEPTFGKWSLEQQRELLEKYSLKESGVTQRQFCREHHLGLSTLSLWLHRSRRGEAAARAVQPGLIPVEISPLQEVSGSLELELPEIGSLKVHGQFDPVQVARLVKALRQ